MAEMPRPHDAQKVAAQQRHTRAFDGDIGSRAHRDADVSGGERGGVVDPVAGHRDDPALFAQPPPYRPLLGGESDAIRLVDAAAPPASSRSAAIVAGAQADLEVALPK